MTAPTVGERPALAGFRAAHDRLGAAQKSGKGAPAYSLYVNRPLGRLFAAIAYRWGLNPNQVTLVSAGFSLAGIIVLASLPMTWWTGVAVSLLLVIGYALDAADGQLARLRGGGSRVGEWLDHMIDSAKIVCLHLAVLVTLARHADLPSPWLLLVPMIFTAVSTVHFFGMILVEQLIREQRAGGRLAVPRRAVADANPDASPLRTLAKIPTDYGVLCLSFLLLGAPSLFVGTYTLLAAATTGYLILILLKWYREVSALDSNVAEVDR